MSINWLHILASLGAEMVMINNTYHLIDSVDGDLWISRKVAEMFGYLSEEVVLGRKTISEGFNHIFQPFSARIHKLTGALSLPDALDIVVVDVLLDVDDLS
jgi:hypothetical protein